MRHGNAFYQIKWILPCTQEDIKWRSQGTLFQRVPLSCHGVHGPSLTIYISWTPTGHFLHPPRLYAPKLSACPFLYLQVQKIFYHSFSPLGAGQELHLHDTHTSFMWLISTKQLVYSRWRKHSPRFTAQWGRQRDTGVKLKLKAVSANRGQEKGSGNTRELSERSSRHRIRTYTLWEQGLKGEKTSPSHVPTGRTGPHNTLSLLSQRSPWGREKCTWQADLYTSHETHT